VTKRVNESEYGLAATVWTTDTDRVARMRSTLRTGQLYVNTHGHVGRNVPWGGFRLSGVGRLYGRDGLYAFTEARSTYIMA
jgi:acyl-CoA reductase-like NAD-dependent aldehyde dehydrogenase